MEYVKGSGEKKGNRVTVVVFLGDDGYQVLGPLEYKAEIEGILDGPVFVGGTYEAPNKSLLKAYYSLDQFFRGRWESEVEGTIENIPYEPGLIY